MARLSAGVGSSTQPVRATTLLRRLRFTSSVRVRILGWYVVLLIAALVFGLFLQRAILLRQLDEEVHAQLAQEVEELQALSTAVNAATGEPFGADVRALFNTFLRGNIPSEGEVLFTIVGGEAFASTATPAQLLDDPAVLEAWAGVTEPRRGELSSPAGDVRYLAVPVAVEEEVGGVFVVAMFMDGRRAEVAEALRVSAGVYGAMFVVITALAWFAAGRVLRPVRLLTDAARSISDDNLRERIPVQGDDEIIELTRTFNDMLDRLEAAFATQRRFIDDAGHELRTPITIVRGQLELLSDDPADREETMRVVIDELDRMSRLVEDMLTLAKADTPDFLRPAPVQLDQFLADLGSKLQGIGSREWLIEGQAKVILVGDRDRLTQAMLNLVRNAAEHTPAGTRVWLGGRATGSDVELWVRDEGPGIPATERAHIFDRFARGRIGRRTTSGAGLGLAIVRAIAEAHGGRVELTSEEGKGSRFTMVLPIDGPESQPG